MLHAPPALIDAVRALAEAADPPRVEAEALAGVLALEFEGDDAFHDRLLDEFVAHDHVVVRGLGSGLVDLLALASLFRARFKPYGDGTRIVKHFRMTPWTRELSYTTADGDFHTDVNTAASPPRVTAIQGVVADPGGPPNGLVFVARYVDVRRHLVDIGADGTIRFLEEVPVALVNDHAADSWQGRMFEGGTLRYHPETLRAAARRGAPLPPDTEDHVRQVHDAATAVASTYTLAAGDVLIVSNARALHRRGPSTVVFRKFPTEFDAREVHVLHLLDEPS